MESKAVQKRITGLLMVGLIAGIVALIGDLLLGWGTYDPALNGLARKLSIYHGISDKRIFWSALCGLIGITVEEIGNYNITNAIRAAWISIGNLLMFVGLLIMTRNKRTDT